VLAYHHVGRPGVTAPWITVTPEHFAEQMAYLADNRLAISVDELAAEFRSGRPGRGGRVLVTLDDAAEDTATTAVPILRRCGIPATVFVATDLLGVCRPFWWNRLHRLTCVAREQHRDLDAFFASGGISAVERGRIDGPWRTLRFLQPQHRDDVLAAAAEWLGDDGGDAGPGAMTHEQLASLDGDGITFGAHTVTHPPLVGLSEEQLAAELTGGRAVLTQLRSSRSLFAYPYGDEAAIDAEAARAVHDAGFELAFTTAEGTVGRGDNPLTLRRVCIDDMPLADVSWLIDHFLGWRGKRP
jgi:peptidoglycan/xylan/chitin deacetylase (PgdA/CDA1 family)